MMAAAAPVKTAVRKVTAKTAKTVKTKAGAE